MTRHARSLWYNTLYAGDTSMSVHADGEWWSRTLEILTEPCYFSPLSPLLQSCSKSPFVSLSFLINRIVHGSCRAPCVKVAPPFLPFLLLLLLMPLVAKHRPLIRFSGPRPKVVFNPSAHSTPSPAVSPSSIPSSREYASLPSTYGRPLLSKHEMDLIEVRPLPPHFSFSSAWRRLVKECVLIRFIIAPCPRWVRFSPKQGRPPATGCRGATRPGERARSGSAPRAGAPRVQEAWM